MAPLKQHTSAPKKRGGSALRAARLRSPSSPRVLRWLGACPNFGAKAPGYKAHAGSWPHAIHSTGPGASPEAWVRGPALEFRLIIEPARRRRHRRRRVERRTGAQEMWQAGSKWPLCVPAILLDVDSKPERKLANTNITHAGREVSGQNHAGYPARLGRSELFACLITSSGAWQSMCLAGVGKGAAYPTTAADGAWGWGWGKVSGFRGPSISQQISRFRGLEQLEAAIAKQQTKPQIDCASKAPGNNNCHPRLSVVGLKRNQKGNQPF